MTTEPWYKDGLRFECTRCGNCCGGGTGSVKVDDDEIAALAKRLDLARADFRERYTRVLSNGEISLNEKPNYDCVFYDKRVGCTVYDDRPRQCRTWPFWESSVRSRSAWAEAARDCPGMKTGELYGRRFIQLTIKNDGTAAVYE